MYFLRGSQSDASDYKIVFDGLVNSISIGRFDVTFTARDRFQILNKTINTLDLFQSISATTYIKASSPGVINIDQSNIGKPIKTVWGRVDGVECYNIDVNPISDGTTNRKWALPFCESTNVSFNAASSAASNTATRTYTSTSALGSINGQRIVEYLKPGDYVLAPNRVALTGQLSGVQVTSVDVDNNFFDHTSYPDFGFSGFSASESLVLLRFDFFFLDDRGRVRSHNRWYRDQYSIAIQVSGEELYYAVTFDDNFESTTAGGNPVNGGFTDDLGATYETIGERWRLFVRCHGQGFLTSSASPRIFGLYCGASHVAEQLIDAMETDSGRIGDFDVSSLGISDVEMALALPTEGNRYPSYREALETVVSSSLMVPYFDDNRQWTLRKIAPMTTENWTATDDDIVGTDWKYSLDYSDVYSAVNLEYNFGHVIDNTTAQISKKTDTFTNSVTRDELLRRNERNVTAQIKNDADADVLSENLQYIFADRKGTLTITLSREFLPIEINDIVKIDSDTIPTFNSNKRYRVVGFEKLTDRIKLTLDDQKGIEDNAGSWN